MQPVVWQREGKIPQSVANPPQQEQEFETLLRSHRGIIFKIVNTYCWDEQDRADLAQEVVAQLWRAWPRYDSARAFTTWMYRIALNVAISYVRKEAQRRGRSVALDEELHDTSAEEQRNDDEERTLRLRQFIERQAPLDRALLVLYLEDKSQKEIAEILGITPTNVSTKINRLKQKIRDEV